MMNWNQEQASLPTRDDYVADALRQAIKHGELAPGSKLNQDEIAKKLNVSRSPVRRALKMLMAEGIIVAPPHRTARVASLSYQELQEIYDLRAMLESRAAALAADTLTDAQIEALATLVEEMDSAESREAWLDLNEAFHNDIYRSTGRSRLLMMIDSLRNPLAPYLRQYIADPEHQTLAQQQHHQLIAAYRARDGQMAEAIITQHILASAKPILAYYSAELAEAPI